MNFTQQSVSNISINIFFSMADPLSVAASSFAVVGVADVVLRASVECCRFLSEIKDAPAEISRLRASIAENEHLVRALKKHLDGLRNPASSSLSFGVDLDSALDHFSSAVRALQRELSALRILAQRYSGTNNTWARAKFVLDERKIKKSSERLDQTKSTLSVALLLVEGKQIASSQKKVEDVVQQKFQQIASTVSGLGTQMQQLSVLRETQKKILVGQRQVALRSQQQLKSTSRIRKDIRQTNQASQAEHRKTREKIAKENQKILNVISLKLDQLPAAICKTSIIAKKSHREIYYIGERREAILTPLLLLKELATLAILDLRSHHAERVAPERLYWIQSELDDLISSATQEAAALCPGSTATSFDRWHYPPGDVNFNGTVTPFININDACGDECSARTMIDGSENVVHRKKFHSDYEVFSSSSIGNLHLIVPREFNVANRARYVDKAEVLFTPSTGICPTAVRARFVTSGDFRLKPTLYTQLNAFRIVEDEYLHACIISHGSLEEIDAAFRSGRISPYDQGDDGFISCLWFAARSNRTDVLRYCESQGFGPSALNGEADVLDGYLTNVTDSSDGGLSDDIIFNVPTYLDENRMIHESSGQMSLLHATAMLPSVESTEAQVCRMRTWIELLKKHNYNFELKDNWGDTPLLDHSRYLGKTSLTILRLLLEFGANPHATDSDGCNVVQRAMYSFIHGSTSDLASRRSEERTYESVEVFEEKLDLLIQAGVDPHHRDRWGNTPSDDAIEHRVCWIIWCRTLERNGMKIEEVLARDIELRLLVESSDEESDDEEIDEEESWSDEAVHNASDEDVYNERDDEIDDRESNKDESDEEETSDEEN